MRRRARCTKVRETSCLVVHSGCLSCGTKFVLFQKNEEADVHNSFPALVKTKAGNLDNETNGAMF